MQIPSTRIIACAALACCVLTACNQPSSTEGKSKAQADTASAPVQKVERSDPAKAPNINPAPLGLELGYATEGDLLALPGAKALEKDQGANKINGGTSYYAKEKLEGFGINGLKEIYFLFNKQQKLDAVLMVLPKGSDKDANAGNFKEVLSMLSGKYTLVRKNVPFVGDSSATLKHGDSQITLDAPHLNFDMQLMYASNDFFAKRMAYLENAEKQAAEQKKSKL